MMNIGGNPEKVSDVEVKKFLDMQRYNIKVVAREIFNEEVMPKLDERFESLHAEIQGVKAASATAHTEILARLERMEKKLN